MTSLGRSAAFRSFARDRYVTLSDAWEEKEQAKSLPTLTGSEDFLPSWYCEGRAQ